LLEANTIFINDHAVTNYLSRSVFASYVVLPSYPTVTHCAATMLSTILLLSLLSLLTSTAPTTPFEASALTAIIYGEGQQNASTSISFQGIDYFTYEEVDDFGLGISFAYN
jgi:hypothetical protein